MSPQVHGSVNGEDKETKADRVILEHAVVKEEDPGKDKYSPRHFTDYIKNNSEK